MRYKTLISIHAPREGGRRHAASLHRTGKLISIHAPREGGDDDEALQGKITGYISIHAPREGGDAVCARQALHPTAYFNPRPPRGGRRRSCTCQPRHVGISIHAPREGGDLILPRGEAGIVISIHAPREGGDSQCSSRN